MPDGGVSKVTLGLSRKDEASLVSTASAFRMDGQSTRPGWWQPRFRFIFDELFIFALDAVSLLTKNRT